MEIDKSWVNTWAKWILSDAANLNRYFNIAAMHPDYSINNQILLVSQAMDRPVTMLKDESSWNKLGVSVNASGQPFYIWEPEKDADGNVIYDASGKRPAGYRYKPMYDVTDTDYEYIKEKAVPEQALEALLTETEIPIVVCDEIKNVTGKRAMYVPVEKTIFVVRSGVAPADDFFCAIATELGHAYCHEQMKDKAMAYNRASYHFGCAACAHALAGKWELSTESLDVSVVPDRWVQMSDRAAGSEILRLRNIFAEIHTKMAEPLKQIMERDRAGGEVHERT